MFPRMFCVLLLGRVLAALMVLRAGAEPKPVPRMQALPLPDSQISFQRDGVEIARLYSKADQKRPFIYPIIGPSGRSLTRMGHPRDAESHSHHHSVWLAHQSINGVNFWEDRGAGCIVQTRLLRFEDGADTAFVETENAWVGADGKALMREKRRTSVQALVAPGEWLLSIDSQFEPPSHTGPAVEIGQSGFGFIGVRMAKSIGVNDGGGTSRNSEGGVDEAGCFRKPARWIDYSGPITASASDGITLLDHPQNLGHPVSFHVRDDGWMGAPVTLAAAHTIEPGESLRLRYGLYVHAGVPAPAQIEALWQRFAATAFEPFTAKK
jgi:hypothetical protein